MNTRGHPLKLQWEILKQMDRTFVGQLSPHHGGVCSGNLRCDMAFYVGTRKMGDLSPRNYLRDDLPSTPYNGAV